MSLGSDEGVCVHRSACVSKGGSVRDVSLCPTGCVVCVTRAVCAHVCQEGGSLCACGCVWALCVCHSVFGGLFPGIPRSDPASPAAPLMQGLGGGN